MYVFWPWPRLVIIDNIASMCVCVLALASVGYFVCVFWPWPRLVIMDNSHCVCVCVIVALTSVGYCVCCVVCVLCLALAVGWFTIDNIASMCVCVLALASVGYY